MTANDTPQPGAEGNFRPGILRQAFDAEYLPPPPGGWEALQEALPKPKRRWPFWWAGALVALLGTVLGIWSLRDAMPRKAQTAATDNRSLPAPTGTTAGASTAPTPARAQAEHAHARQAAVAPGLLGTPAGAMAEGAPADAAGSRLVAANGAPRLQTAGMALATTAANRSNQGVAPEATNRAVGGNPGAPAMQVATSPSEQPTPATAIAAADLSAGPGLQANAPAYAPHATLAGADAQAAPAIAKAEDSPARQAEPAAADAPAAPAKAQTAAAAELAARLALPVRYPMPEPGAVATVPLSVTPTAPATARRYTLEAGLHALVRQREMALAQRADLTALSWDPSQPQPTLGVQAFANLGYQVRPGVRLGAGLGLGGWQDVLRLQMAPASPIPVVEQHADGSIGTHLVHEPAHGHTLRWSTLQAHGELWGRVGLPGSPLSLQAGGGFTLLQPLGRAEAAPQQTLGLPHLLLALRYQRGPLFYEAGMRRMPRQGLAVPGMVQVQYQLFHLGVGYTW